MVEILPFQEKHCQATKKLVLSILEGEFGWNSVKRPDLDGITEVYQKDPKSNFWIALHDGEVVGTIALLNFKRGKGYLKRMYVAKTYRSTGLAGQLLEALLSHARRNGFKKIFLGTSPEMQAATRFYEKNGFTLIKRLPKTLPTYGDSVFYEKKI